MYIKIFVLITVLYVQIKKNLHFQDKAVDELLKKKKKVASDSQQSDWKYSAIRYH